MTTKPKATSSKKSQANANAAVRATATAKAAEKSKPSAIPAAAAKSKSVAKPKAKAQTATKTKTSVKLATKVSSKPKAAASPRNIKKFNAPQSQDFTISDNSGVIGQMRIKPNAVAWKPKRGKSFHQISLEQLATFAAEHGREVQN